MPPDFHRFGAQTLRNRWIFFLDPRLVCLYCLLSFISLRPLWKLWCFRRKKNQNFQNPSKGRSKFACGGLVRLRQVMLCASLIIVWKFNEKIIGGSRNTNNLWIKMPCLTSCYFLVFGHPRYISAHFRNFNWSINQSIFIRPFYFFIFLNQYIYIYILSYAYNILVQGNSDTLSGFLMKT